MDRPSPYHILKLLVTASEQEIRQAYRQLAMKFHPDRNPGEPEMEEQFKEVQRAYETLLGGIRKNEKEPVAAFRWRVDNPAPDLTDPFLGFYRALTAHLHKNQNKQHSPRKAGEGERNN